MTERFVHICWRGVVNAWNPDGRCFTCETLDNSSLPGLQLGQEVADDQGDVQPDRSQG